jgi:hypothetical protein
MSQPAFLWFLALAFSPLESFESSPSLAARLRPCLTPWTPGWSLSWPITSEPTKSQIRWLPPLLSDSRWGQVSRAPSVKHPGSSSHRKHKPDLSAETVSGAFSISGNPYRRRLAISSLGYIKGNLSWSGPHVGKPECSTDGPGSASSWICGAFPRIWRNAIQPNAIGP